MRICYTNLVLLSSRGELGNCPSSRHDSRGSVFCFRPSFRIRLFWVPANCVGLAIFLCGALQGAHSGALRAHRSAGCPSLDAGVVSSFMPDLQVEDPKAVIERLRSTPFNVVSTTISWRIVEKEKGS